MKYRTLGRTGLKMPIMGFGTGGKVDPLGQVSDRPEMEAHTLIHRAYDLGIHYFDTAPGYMESEAILGRALRSLQRDKVIVSTKITLAGSMPGKPLTTMPAKEITETVEQSLKRMQVDYVDLLLKAVAGPQYLDKVMNEQLPVIIKLKEQGKIRFLGSSEQTRSDGGHQWLKKILPLDLLDVVMVGHNLINQSAQRSLFPICQQQNAGAFTGAVFVTIITWIVQYQTAINLFLFSAINIFSCVVIGYGISLIFPERPRDLSGLTLYDMNNNARM